MLNPSRVRAYTLIEVLVTVTILGIAAALLVPSVGTTGVLRVQAAVRTVVADITAAQSDAIAFQEPRAIVFDLDNNGYTVVQVRNNVIDADAFSLSRVRFTTRDFGDAQLVSASLGNTDNTLVFDEMGAPVTAPGTGTPLTSGTIDLTGSSQRFQIGVEGFTGRVTVTNVTAAATEE